MGTLIASGMVLQQQTTVKLWGSAVPGSLVELELAGRKSEVEADRTGDWTIYFPTGKAGGPYELLFRALDPRSGQELACVIVKDVCVGEVWLCSGQSNMELPLTTVYDNYYQLRQGYKNPWIRQFTATVNTNFSGPQKDLNKGSWLSVCEEISRKSF